MAADACAGLHAAHELRDDQGMLLHVVHRDVTPQNLLVTIGGVTKVIDFGIAQALDRSAEATKTGMLKGKAQYMSPEQVRGKNVDRRADLWAMGTILYQYLSGRLPYDAKNELAILRALDAGKPPPPLPPTVPAQVAQVVHRALTPLDQRFQSALEMQRALEAVISQPVTATDVAAFMARHLEERIEGRRKDLAEAIAELEAASGKPKLPRTRKTSLQELARPPILDQVLGPSPGDSSAMPQLSPVAAARIVAEAPPMPSRPPMASSGDDAIPTALREGPIPLRPVHYAMMVLGAVVPMVVLGLVVWVALHGPIGHKGGPHGGPIRGAASAARSGAP